MTKSELNTAFEQTSFLYGGNAQYIEQIYAKYLENPAAVDPHWRQFFAGLEDSQAQVTGPIPTMCRVTAAPAAIATGARPI